VRGGRSGVAPRWLPAGRLLDLAGFVAAWLAASGRCCLSALAAKTCRDAAKTAPEFMKTEYLQ
jgi:hypothetical protein